MGKRDRNGELEFLPEDKKAMTLNKNPGSFKASVWANIFEKHRHEYSVIGDRERERMRIHYFLGKPPMRWDYFLLLALSFRTSFLSPPLLSYKGPPLNHMALLIWLQPTVLNYGSLLKLAKSSFFDFLKMTLIQKSVKTYMYSSINYPQKNTEVTTIQV